MDTTEVETVKETNRERRVRLTEQVLQKLRTDPNFNRHVLAASLGLEDDQVFGTAFTAARDKLRVADGVDIRPLGGGMYGVADKKQSVRRGWRDVGAAKKKLTRSTQKAALATSSEDAEVSASAKRLANKVAIMTSRTAGAPQKTDLSSMLPKTAKKPRSKK